MLKNNNFLPGITLLFFLAAGIIVYDDYGIAWDESFQYYENGSAVWNYLATNDFDSYLKNPEKYHGPAFELVLIAAEKITGITGDRQIFLQRHLLSFLFYWLSGVALLLLLRKRYHSTLTVTLGICWYFLMPRIFADSFYNTKDVPFMAMTMICLYSLYTLLERKNTKWLIIHGTFCGFLIAIRIMGILVPFLTVCALIFGVLFYKSDKSKTLIHVLLFGLITFLSTVLFWPILWLNPIHHLIEAWREMSNYPWASTVLYRGDFMDTLILPWHYSLTWLGITTPVMYLILVIASLYFLTIKLKSVFKEESALFEYLLIALFAAPLISVVVLNSVMYDGWRHLFFLYAPMCLLMIFGFNRLEEIFRSVHKFNWLVIPVIFFTIFTGYQMVMLHPYQNIYFNKLAGKNTGAVQNFYELDYWGISYREALEKLAVKDSSSQIKLNVSNAPGIMNSWILPLETRKRFQFVSTKDSADYFITNYRWEVVGKSTLPLIDSIIVDGARISGTYKVR